MQLVTKDIRLESKHLGETVWICHYLRPNLDNKPLRNVPPTKAKIRSNEFLPENKRIYYSQIHFCPLTKNGKFKRQYISPVDGTGRRSSSGNELFVFTTEKECVDRWNEQVRECCNRLLNKQETAFQYWRDEKLQLSKQLIVN